VFEMSDQTLTPARTVIEHTALLPGLVDIVYRDEGLAFLFRDGRALASLSDYDKETNTEVVTCPMAGEKKWWLWPSEQGVRDFYKLFADGRMTPADIWEYVRRKFEKHCLLPTADYYDLLTAWVFTTYRIDWWRFFPILFLFGVGERGKNRTGECAIHMAHRGYTEIGATEAAVFRLAEAARNSLFLDVEDINQTVRSGSLKSDVIMGRAERDKGVTRVIDPSKPGIDGLTSYFCYGPTIVATNTEPYSDKFLSRGLFIAMRRASQDYPPVHRHALIQIKNLLTAWRWRTMETGAQPDPAVQGRARSRFRDITQPLRQITALVAPDRLPHVDAALDHLYAARQSSKSDSETADLLRAVLMVIEEKHTQQEEDGRVSTDSVRQRFLEITKWEKCSPKRIGSGLNAMGFHKADTSKERGWGYTPALLEELKREYGLSEG
jgi:hypothetical protein